MRGFEGTMEWLRPLVDSKAWDFCVVWKLGDDPSRFIEWKGCCCSGGVNANANVKLETDELQQCSSAQQLCKDARFRHSIRSKACAALSHFPSFISLYAGIHGEVAMSNQAKWINHPSNETMGGTQVLIPLHGGLIELFASKNMPRDENIIKLVTTHCNALLEPEVIAAESYVKEHLDKLHLNTLAGKGLHNFSIVPDSLDGSSTGSSTPPSEHSPFALGSAYVFQGQPLKQLVGTSYGGKRLRGGENVSELEAGLVLDLNNKSAKGNVRATKKQEKENYHSKNLVTERNRRKKIKDGLFKLRALVPKISKMDRAAILTDAIEYIEELQEAAKKLQEELAKIEEENSQKRNEEPKVANSDTIHKGKMSAVEQNQNFSGLVEMAKKEIQVEVNEITKREYLIKLYCEHKRGGFGKLMEGIDSLGLEVIDANVTTFHGKVLNIFKVEANGDFQYKKLRDLLTELTS